MSRFTAVMQKQIPDLIARACLTVVLLFSMFRAAHAYAEDAMSSMLFHLGMLCIIVNLLASPRGQLLPPRHATIANVHEQIQRGVIARTPRVQSWLFMLGFALLAASIYVAL